MAINMRETKIVHIDYGTKGNSGFYLEQILITYTGKNSVDAYVHSEYYGECGKAKVIKIFDSMSKYITWGTGKNIYKLMDLYIVYFIILLRLLVESRKYNIVLFVSLFQSFHAYELFLRYMSRYVKIIVTVHDAIEHRHSYPKFIMSNRDDILKHASYIIVHGHESTEILKYLAKPILEIPFPLMKSLKTKTYKNNDQIRFLYIGHIREEKGVDILIEAWRKIHHHHHHNVMLTIAGTKSCKLKIDFNNLKNFRTIFDYIDDETFVDLISKADYVVLPYVGGTNSGVFSVATSLKKPCITSSIPLFTQSPFSIESLRFSGGVESLLDLMEAVVLNHSIKYIEYQDFLSSQIVQYQSNFKIKLNHVYNCILMNDVI